MKIKNPLDKTLWPNSKAGVLEVAELWYKPELVPINYDAINKLPQGTIIPPLETDLTIDIENKVNVLPQTIQYSIALNSINYMFWDLDENKKFVRYEKDGKVGAMLMTELFSNAWKDPESAITKARYGFPMTEEDVKNIFGNMSDIAGRTNILNEVLTSPQLGLLAEEFAKNAQNGLPFTTEYAAKLAQAFPQAYGDEVLKKSQLAVSGMWRNATDLGIHTQCDLTAFADYQVPNVLLALGLIDYNEELLDKIKTYQLIEENSPEEKAMRGASILAVEILSQQQGVNVADVDYWLWSKRKEPKTPFHLTVTDKY